MSKYTDEQLKEMAQEVVEAERFGDMRALQLFITIAVRAGLDPNQVRGRIHDLASG